MITDKASFGIFLRKARVTKGISQLDLAKKLGYSSPQYVSNWERGLSGPPTEKLYEICKALGIDTEVILRRILKETEEWLRVQFRTPNKR